MKRFILICLLIFGLSSPVSAISLIGSGISGEPSCDSCTGALLFSWYCNDPTVGDTGYSPCGCSAGDSEASANGTVGITSGEVITTDTGEDGADYYSFDVSSNDLVVGSVGTTFIQFTVTTWIDDLKIWFVVPPAGNWLNLFLEGADEMTFSYRGGYDADAISTNSADLAVDTLYKVRVRWREASSPYVTLTVWAGTDDWAETPIEDREYTSTLTTWTGQPTTDGYRVGNTAAVNGVVKIDFIKTYNDYRDTP
ncbi:MAG TPA: hypothetical protein VMW34_00320 [Anaerolineales bacterium]|nr:hypothetical protein [Anaerolineales bacterium]